MSLYSRAEKVMRPALCSDTAVDLLQEADATIAAKDAEIARLIAANGDLQRWFDAAFSEFTRKDQEIARLREALTSLLGAKCWEDDIAASAQARAALAPVEVGNG